MNNTSTTQKKDIVIRFILIVGGALAVWGGYIAYVVNQ
jgi:hypothetical protein